MHSAAISAASKVVVLSIVAVIDAAASNLEAELTGGSISHIKFGFGSNIDVGFGSGSVCVGFRFNVGIICGDTGATFFHLLLETTDRI